MLSLLWHNQKCKFAILTYNFLKSTLITLVWLKEGNLPKGREFDYKEELGTKRNGWLNKERFSIQKTGLVTKRKSWCKEKKRFIALKDLNFLKKYIKNQEASNNFKIVFTLSRGLHLHWASLLTDFKWGATAVFIILCDPRFQKMAYLWVRESKIWI